MRLSIRALGGLLVAACFGFGGPGLGGCALEHEVARDEHAIVDGSAEGIGLLAFVNDSATSFELLDSELDRRAAEGLVEGRPFATVAEVDAIKYVGTSAMAKLLAMAEQHGYVPSGSDILGSFDGVSFTVDQAQAALAIINEESEGVLRNEVGLASRAITSILEARPVSTMDELAGLYWVGKGGLTKLRDYVDPFVDAPYERIDCKHDGECGDNGVCEGFVNDGSSEYGKCHEVEEFPGYWSQCGSNGDCAEGMFCSGLTLGGGGFCSPDWMQDTFFNDTQRFIPADGSTVTTSVVVYGQATVPMDLVVDLELAHDQPEDLRITLFDPNGADAVIWDGPSEGGAAVPASFVALGNISRDDEVNGRWLLQVTNVGGGGLGNLHGWQLWVSSRYD